MFKDAIQKLKNDKKIVPFNPVIANGVGYVQAKDGIHHRVFNILRRELTYDSEVNSRLPVGMEAYDYRIMSPFENYIYMIRDDGRGSRKSATINIAPTNSYMVMTYFRIPGEARPAQRPIKLPFITRGGLMHYYGVRYHVAPVIHQPGICREHGGVFINFDFRRKVSLKFCKNPARILVNGMKEELFIPGTRNLFVPNSPTGNDTDEKPLAYWLFGRYGFCEAIEKYTGASVRIIPAWDVPKIDTTKEVVITSGELQYAKQIQYALVVPMEAFPNYEKNRWDHEEHLLLTLCASFFKAAHYYASKQPGKSGRAPALPPLFTVALDFDIQQDIDNLNSAACWREILGRSVSGTKLSDVEIIRNMASHYMECERYMNDTFRGELLAEDPDIDPDMDVFDFLLYVTKLMLRTRLTHQDDCASMYGKRLTVTDYLLLGQNAFTPTVSRIRWQLSQLECHNPESYSKAIKDVLNTEIDHNLVMRGISGNGAISFFNASTESMVLGVSNHAVSQTETESKRGKKGGKTANLNDRTKHTHVSHAELGNVYYIPKSAPFKVNVLNVYMQTSRQLVMLRNPKLLPYTKPAEEDIAKIGY